MPDRANGLREVVRALDRPGDDRREERVVDEVVDEAEVQLRDLRARFVDHLRIRNVEGAEKDVLTRDGVHLNAAGSRLLADAVRPRLVRHLG